MPVKSAQLSASVPPEVKTISAGQAIQALRNAFPNGLNDGLGFAAFSVGAARVAKNLHGLDHGGLGFGGNWGRRSVVEVDTHRSFRLCAGKGRTYRANGLNGGNSSFLE